MPVDSLVPLPREVKPASCFPPTPPSDPSKHTQSPLGYARCEDAVMSDSEGTFVTDGFTMPGCDQRRSGRDGLMIS